MYDGKIKTFDKPAKLHSTPDICTSYMIYRCPHMREMQNNPNNYLLRNFVRVSRHLSFMMMFINITVIFLTLFYDEYAIHKLILEINWLLVLCAVIYKISSPDMYNSCSSVLVNEAIFHIV